MNKEPREWLDELFPEGDPARDRAMKLHYAHYVSAREDRMLTHKRHIKDMKMIFSIKKPITQ